MAADHPLAARDSVCYEDLGDYLVPAVTAADYWTAAIVPFHTRSRRPIHRGPAVANFQELITAVAAGTVVCPVHDHANRYYLRPDIRYLPITDETLAQWALVWRTATHNELIRAFADVAEELGPLHLPAGTGAP